MPYKFQESGDLIPASKDRRRKLTHDQREEIKANELGLSQRALAAEYDVSRRTIQFIQDPVKLEENKLRRKERGGWEQYYDKEAHADSVRDHRRYKKKLADSGDLIPGAEVR